MILKPFPAPAPTQTQEVSVGMDVDAVLRAAGLKKSKTATNSFKELLAENGAALEDVARALGESLTDEKTRLQAAKAIMEVHGLTLPKQAVALPQITINIGKTVEQPERNILDLVHP